MGAWRRSFQHQSGGADRADGGTSAWLAGVGPDDKDRQTRRPNPPMFSRIANLSTTGTVPVGDALVSTKSEHYSGCSERLRAMLGGAPVAFRRRWFHTAPMPPPRGILHGRFQNPVKAPFYCCSTLSSTEDALKAVQAPQSLGAGYPNPGPARLITRTADNWTCREPCRAS